LEISKPRLFGEARRDGNTQLEERARVRSAPLEPEGIGKKGCSCEGKEGGRAAVPDRKSKEKGIIGKIWDPITRRVDKVMPRSKAEENTRLVGTGTRRSRF